MMSDDLKYVLYYDPANNPPRRCDPVGGRGNIGFDLAVDETFELRLFEHKIIPVNLWMLPVDTRIPAVGALPEIANLNLFSFGELRLRSSTFSKKGVSLRSSNLIDPCYCGDSDQIKISVYREPRLGIDCWLGGPPINLPDCDQVAAHFSGQPIRIEKGEYIVQFVLMQALPVQVEILPKPNDLGDSRGGFGSTGGYKK